MISQWSQFIDKVRSFFKERGFLEVHTPILQQYPNLDPNVEPMEVLVKEKEGKKKMWLHTSPEHAMKKILSKEKKDIFQICKVFRNGEWGRFHLPEFTMLEWYRINADYNLLIQDIVDLLKYLGLSGDYETVTVEKAFEEYAGVILSEEEEIFKNNLMAYGYEFDMQEDWEALFYRVYIDVEKHLGQEKPTFLVKFPQRLAIYSKVKDGYAERFELYIKGVEIANGWTEETDPTIIRQRMETFSRGRDLPVDEELIKAMESMPPCAGCSIGLERLFMVIHNIDDIRRLIYY